MCKKIKLLPALIMLAGSLYAGDVENLTIDVLERGAKVAPSMYGIFFEEINHAGDGGLYAELIQNRSFEELEMPEGYRAEGDRLITKPVKNHVTGKVESASFKWTTEPVPAWKLSDENLASMKLTKENPKFETAPNSLEVEVKDASMPVRVENEGYWGIGLREGEKYKLRAILRMSAEYKGKVFALLLSNDGEVLAKAPLKLKNGNDYSDIKIELVPSKTDFKGKFAIELNAKGKVWLDYVSLFPETTFKNRKNGLRKDVAETLAGLHPAFVRWPGGCVVEGISLENRFEWKKTLGDPAARSGEYSTWGYRSSYGFGYHEMLQFCEDINSKAMFVCNVGMGCQFRMCDASKDDEIQYYLQDCLDAIEYAIGEVNTTWGAKRAAAGHPKPFPLKYVEIGNENHGDEYDKRFNIFYKAIKERYPELVLISNHGINGIGKAEKTDMVDPHYYVAPDFFYEKSNIFDNVKRGDYKIYVGEYAVNNSVGAGNMNAALAEAAFISGMERNGDIVEMASYAPLLQHRNDRCWAVNLIWHDSEKVLGRSSYYVQKMAVENRPDYNLKMNKNLTLSKPTQFKNGKIGFGSWQTQVEFKDIKILENGKEVKVDVSAPSQKRGLWKFENGVLCQTSLERQTKYSINDFKSNNFTLEFKARRTGGAEGFFVYYGLSENEDNGFVFNVAGWGNSATGVEKVSGGRNSGMASKQVPHRIESDKWYDVKVVVTPENSEIFIDGKSLLSHTPISTPLQFFASGYSEDSGEVIIKVVNAEKNPYKTKINLNGAKRVQKKGKVICLLAKSLDDENSFEEPKKIFPQESKFNGFKKSFTYEFQPFSYTILRIKVEK